MPGTPTTSPRFATTRWSLVLAAGETTTDAARAALDELCRAYWYPLYAAARRGGRSPEQAEDLVQGFFTRLLDKHALAAATPERGRFRSFLRASFEHYASNERAREHAQKRGGDRLHLSLYGEEGERRYALEPADAATPERAFERDWALELLDRALRRVRADYVERGQEPVFEALKGALTAPGGHAPSAAAGLGLSPGAARVAAHRLRERYRRALRAELADTVGDDADADDELRALFAALATP